MAKNTLKTPPSMLKQEGPKFFFKYLPISTYSLQNLDQEQLWLTQIKSFNDPFEFKFIKRNEELLTKEENETIQMFLDSGVLCLSTHDDLIINPNQTDQNIFPDNMLMWSHYAEQHYGFCLGLRKESIIYPVKYDDEFPIVDPELDLNIYIQTFVAMHTKQKCWSYENEYRAINTEIKHGGKGYKDFFDLERIYFGLRTPKGEINVVKNILRGRNIEYYQAKLEGTKYKLIFERI